MESIQLNLKFKKTKARSEDVSVKERRKMLLTEVERLNCLVKKEQFSLYILYLEESALEGKNTGILLIK